MSVKSFTPQGFYPSANRGGLDDGRVYRMMNMLIRGQTEGQPYAEVYGGSLDLAQNLTPIDLTGTLTITANSSAVVGSGTSFTTQLHLGQEIIVHKTGAPNSVPMVVDSIKDDTHFTACRPAETSISGATGSRLPVCWEMNKVIAAALRGNAIMFDNGNIFGAGDGVLTLDGSVLPGSSMTLGRIPQLAVLNAGSYTVFQLAMQTPGNVSAADGGVAAGVAITAASNANPVSLTSAAHGLTTGQAITISGATGAWAAINGTWTVTKTGANTFTIPTDSTGFGGLAGVPVFATGVKNMVAATTYSLRACAARQATGGYANPGAKITFTLASGHVPAVTLPAVDSVHGSDAWALFVPLQQFVGTTGVQGPWFQLPTPHPFNLVTAQATGNPDVLSTGGVYNFEWNDSEIGGSVTPQLSYDNDPPPQCEFIGTLGNTPIYISCQGVTGTSPGPVIVPAKPSNIEAAPEELGYVTAGRQGTEDIIGFIAAQGRIYLMCVNTLQILQSSQTQDPLVPPFAIRPFWHSGFKNPYSLIFVDGFLLGWTNHGLAKSLADGDEGSEQFNFTTPMDEYFRTLNSGHIMLRQDPANNAVCVFHIGDSINSSGFWTTRVWTYNLGSSQWTGDVTLTSTTQDMLVSGVAEVNGRLIFLAGGLTNSNTVVVKTYQWDQPSAGQTIPYFLATQFSDGGDSVRPTRVGPMKLFAQQAAGGTAGIYAARPGDSINITDLVAGASGGVSGTITLPSNSSVTAGTLIKLNIPNLDVFSVRVGGSWTGGVNVPRDRIDRISFEDYVEGARR